MSKYQLTSNPGLPGKCIACNNHVKPHAPVIDLVTSIDYYGAVVICTSCVRELIEVTEYDPLTVAEFDNIRLKEMHKELLDELSVYRDFFTSLTNVLTGDSSRAYDSLAKSVAAATERVRKSAEQPLGETSGTPKQDAEWGPKNFSEPSDESLLFDSDSQD